MVWESKIRVPTTFFLGRSPRRAMPHLRRSSGMRTVLGEGPLAWTCLRTYSAPVVRSEPAMVQMTRLLRRVSAMVISSGSTHRQQTDLGIPSMLKAHPLPKAITPRAVSFTEETTTRRGRKSPDRSIHVYPPLLTSEHTLRLASSRLRSSSTMVTRPVPMMLTRKV